MSNDYANPILVTELKCNVAQNSIVWDGRNTIVLKDGLKWLQLNQFQTERQF